MRICSLLPGATEIAFALGLGDQVVGVSHECDFPIEAMTKPIVVRSRVPAERLSSVEIDGRVRDLLHSGQSLYTIDEEIFREAAPDVILTQELCEVCAIDFEEVDAAAKTLPKAPRIVSLFPRSLADVLGDIERVGAAAECIDKAQALAGALRRRIAQVRGLTQEATIRPRVACIEWFEPLYAAGHWVPEMVEIAGGWDAFGRKGESSARLAWPQVLAAAPEIMVLMPCGFDVKRTVAESAVLKTLDGWKKLPAVQAGKVYAVDGSAYFSRPGPRLIDGLEILARIIHSEIFPAALSPEAAERVTIEVC